MANPLEAIALAFVKKELKSNPALIGKLIGHVLEQKGVDATIVADVQAFVTEIAPYLLDKL